MLAIHHGPLSVQDQTGSWSVRASSSLVWLPESTIYDSSTRVEWNSHQTDDRLVINLLETGRQPATFSVSYHSLNSLKQDLCPLLLPVQDRPIVSHKEQIGSAGILLSCASVICSTGPNYNCKFRIVASLNVFLPRTCIEIEYFHQKRYLSENMGYFLHCPSWIHQCQSFYLCE